MKTPIQLFNEFKFYECVKGVDTNFAEIMYEYIYSVE